LKLPAAWAGVGAVVFCLNALARLYKPMSIAQASCRWYVCCCMVCVGSRYFVLGNL
jgi:hypothetical protein